MSELHTAHIPQKGELDAHFESEIEAQAEAVQEEVYRTRNWIERMFMEPQDLLEYLNATREQRELLSQRPTVEHANVIPLQKNNVIQKAA